jgi:hypothetical protein
VSLSKNIYIFTPDPFSRLVAQTLLHLKKISIYAVLKFSAHSTWGEFAMHSVGATSPFPCDTGKSFREKAHRMLTTLPRTDIQ